MPSYKKLQKLIYYMSTGPNRWVDMYLLSNLLGRDLEKHD